MSVRQSTKVWDLQLAPTEKLILLKLADCADDEGRNAYPSVRSLALWCGVSERTVQYTLAELKRARIIVEQRAAGRHRATSYQILAANGTKLTTTSRGADIAPMAVMGATDGSMGATDGNDGCNPLHPIRHKRDPSNTTTVEKAAGAAPVLGRPQDAGLPGLTQLTPEDLQRIWNAHCGALTKCVSLSEQRKTFARARLREYPLEADWVACVKQIAAADWTHGKNERGWVADFDYFIKRATIVKSKEGGLTGAPKLVKVSADATRRDTRDANVAHVAKGGIFVPGAKS